MSALPTTKYIPIVDSLRGWAASGVCFYHFIWGTVDYIEAPWARAWSYWGQYGVTLFFVLSGLVLPLALLRHGYTINYFAAFLWRRLWRLEPPYLFSIIITILYLGLSAWRHQQEFLLSGWNVALHLGYWIPFVEGEDWLNPVYWSLAVEFQYYCLLGLLFPLWIYPRAIVRWSCYFLLLLLSFVSDQKDLVFRWLPLFLISGSYILYKNHYIKALELLSIFILGFACLTYHLALAHSIVVIGVLVLVHFFPLCNPQWSAWLGHCSYSLYLLHWPIGQALINVLSHHYDLPYQKVLVLLLGYGSSILAAAFFYYYLEKPSQYQASTIVYGAKDKTS